MLTRFLSILILSLEAKISYILFCDKRLAAKSNAELYREPQGYIAHLINSSKQNISFFISNAGLKGNKLID